MDAAPEDLKGRTHVLVAALTPLTLPGVTAYFDHARLARTHYVATATLSIVDPVLFLDEERSAFGVQFVGKI